MNLPSSVPIRLEHLGGAIWSRAGAVDSRLEIAKSWGEHARLFVWFYGPQFSDASVEEAAALCKCIPRLRAIKVSGTLLTPTGAQRLRALLPDIPVDAMHVAGS